MKLTHLCILTLLGLSGKILAQPGWSVVPADYEFTMTVTGVAVIECSESTDENDLIAAFINGEVRGVQSLSTAIGDRQYAYLIIYENEFEGNTITFKIYDASEDQVYDAQQSITFSENAIMGGEDHPFIFNDQYNLVETFLTNDSISEFATAGNEIGILHTVTERQDTVTLEYEFIDGPLGADNSFFQITGSSLILREDINPAVKSAYQLHISSTTPDGCSREDVFILSVTGQTTTATNNYVEKAELLVFPNPAFGNIRLVNADLVDRVMIYSLDGRQLYASQTTGPSIDISFLSAGMYIIVCRIEGEYRTTRLMVN